MRSDVDGERGGLGTTTVVTVVAAVVVLALAFTAFQMVTGQLNAADVLHRLPKPVAVLFVEDPDASMRFDCEDVDERDVTAVQRYAEANGLTVVFRPEGGPPERVAWIEWVHWRDRLVVHAGDEVPPEQQGGSGCPG